METRAQATPRVAIGRDGERDARQEQRGGGGAVEVDDCSRRSGGGDGDVG